MDLDFAHGFVPRIGTLPWAIIDGAWAEKDPSVECWEAPRVRWHPAALRDRRISGCSACRVRRDRVLIGAGLGCDVAIS